LRRLMEVAWSVGGSQATNDGSRRQATIMGQHYGGFLPFAFRPDARMSA
jgi:hypothetical protein